MLPELEDYDWKEVFKYAGSGDQNYGGYGQEPPFRCNRGVRYGEPSRLTEKAEPFSREDVKRIIAMVEGMNDESDWLAVFELKDGRFASIRAGCDYTGWG